MTATDFLACFPRNHRNGPSDWHVACPAHDDGQNPDQFSLHVSAKEDRLLLFCFAGCSTESILSALGLTAADLFIGNTNSGSSNGHATTTAPAGWTRVPAASTGRAPQPEAAEAPAPIATLAAFAALKKISVEFLLAEGWRDTPKGIAIPYRQRDGSTWRVRGRSSLKPGEGFVWDSQKDKPLIPYGRHHLDRAIDKDGLWLVEGESDAVTARYQGLQCLGLPGNMAVKALSTEDMAGIDKVWIVVEPGQSGEGFTQKLRGRLQDLDWKGMAKLVHLPSKDISDLHVADPEGFLEAVERAKAGAEDLCDAPESVQAAQPAPEKPRSRAVWVPEVIQRYINETQADHLGRLPFNVPAFDAALRGLARGDVAVVLGSLGVGKTGFLVNLLERITTPKRVPALLASLEMADTQVAERMASFTLLKPGREIEGLVARRDPWVVHALTQEAADAWKHVRIIDAALSIEALDQELALAAEESPLRVVAVDYLGLLTTGTRDAYQEVSRVARATKGLAKKHAVSILLLVQTSRAGAAGEPVTIHMARDSGVIGEAVDLAFGLWRPALAEKASPEDKVRWEHYLIAKVLKARSAEQGQFFRMDWRPSTWHIDNAVRIDPDTLEEMRDEQSA